MEGRFDSWWEKVPSSARLLCGKVDVIGARPLSARIAEEFEVKHESPQLLWLSSEGRLLWHADHEGITVDKLEEALKG